jgi:hypothetical protein
MTMMWINGLGLGMMMMVHNLTRAMARNAAVHPGDTLIHQVLEGLPDGHPDDDPSYQAPEEQACHQRASEEDRQHQDHRQQQQCELEPGPVIDDELDDTR